MFGVKIGSMRVLVGLSDVLGGDLGYLTYDQLHALILSIDFKK